MSSQTPIIRQVAWPAVIPQLCALAAAVAIGYFLVGRSGISLGALAYLAYSIGSRQIICRAQRAGISLVKQGRFAEAIPMFQESFDFFERNSWIDRYRPIRHPRSAIARWLWLTSVSAIANSGTVSKAGPTTTSVCSNFQTAFWQRLHFAC
jgi:hypothetical protein